MMRESDNERSARAARHCMIVHSYYPYDETRVQREAEALVAAGIEVDVICLRQRGDARTEVVDGVRIRRLNVSRNRGSSAAAQLLEYLSFFVRATGCVSARHWRRRYDVVQVHNLPDFLVFAAIVPWIGGARVVLDIHDLMPEFACSRFGLPPSHVIARLLRLQERLACRFADHVITVTDAWRQTLVGRSVAADRCSVVMNAADVRYFRRAPIDGRRRGTAKTTAAEDRVEVLYHGTISERYGVDLLLEAVARVRADLPGLSVRIHGRGEYVDYVREAIVRLQLDDVVTLETSFISAEELGQLVADADIGVVPYRRDVFTDGILPTKLLEYAAVGVCGLVAATPAIEACFDASMVEYFVAGNVDDLAHRLRALAVDPDRRLALATTISRYDDEHGWGRQASRFVDLIARLGSVRRGARPIELAAPRLPVNQLVDSARV